ncbi:MAG: hypothetical protein GX823_01710 [Clostridiales bacterium]|nr:hypothetical protein [Clostridiales bacterium]
MANSKHSSGPPDIGSWIVTIIMLFLFWPVGIFMLIGRLREAAKYGADKTQSARHETAQAASLRQNAARQPGQPAKQAAARADTEKKTASKSAEQSPSARAFARLKKEQASTKSISTVVLIAAIIGFVAGGAGLLSAISSVATGAVSYNDAVLGAFFALGGAALLLVRSFIPKRVKLRRRYLAFLGERGAMKTSDFAAALARSPEKVQNDLQEMIEDGYFGTTAYIDKSLEMLILDSATADSIRSERARPPRQEEEELSEYDRILRALRSLDNRIADATISYKIERIESTCAKIFRTVEENPQKLPQIRRFMSYYLPTTLKLLRSYATLEKQGIQGENIASTKDSINSVLGKLVAGFDAQLDQLFLADAMDISADIDVLQNMMAQDGLTESGPMAAQASASDVGYLDIK